MGWVKCAFFKREPDMSNKIFEAALGIASPWYINGVDFDATGKLLTINVDFIAGSRFRVPEVKEHTVPTTP